MKRIEQAVIEAIIPFRASTDPLLAVLALVRILRVMLREAKPSAQRELLPVLFSYLEGRTRLPGETHEAGRLWLPWRRVH
jgi:hypothetical protein